jgi:hypothetical protein
MADVEIREPGRVHALACPSNIGELRKLMNGFLLACQRDGAPIDFDDEVVVTVDAGAIVLTRITP